MGIKTVSERQFESFKVGRMPGFHKLIADEREWYADDAENILGIVIRDKVDNDWTSVVLGRDTDSVFKWIAGETCIPTQDEARQQLLEEMKKIEASGKTVFPQ